MSLFSEFKADREPPEYAHIDLDAVRAYRLGRVRAELSARDIAAAVLVDPLNVRYATDSTNMQVWVTHNAARYVFVPASGPVVMFDFHNTQHRSHGLGTVDEVRKATGVYYFSAGPRLAELAGRWAAELEDLLRAHGGGSRRLAVDRAHPLATSALERLGVEVCDGGEVMEQARAIKSPQEIQCIRASIAACEEGMSRMREHLSPGMTENELWSILHQTNIELGGEWIETRLLTSGPKTNPWFQECGFRVIQAGDLVSFDTDLIGPFGYCADISRTYLCGDGKASDAQRRLYELARQQICSNIELIRPGMGLRELAEKSFKLPENCRANRYSVVAHGVGLCDEYPHIAYPEDFDEHGYDGVILPNMTLCVESYVGEEGGAEGVKLEEQVLVTEAGVEVLSTFPFEDVLF
ncbi:MAG: M24 family metallopeptidase [Alphaproteobacteria bacterium]